MSLIALIIILVIVGVVFALVPVDAQIRRYILIIIGIIVAVVLVVWLLNVFGVSLHGGGLNTPDRIIVN
jgi:amino acid transporter